MKNGRGFRFLAALLSFIMVVSSVGEVMGGALVPAVTVIESIVVGDGIASLPEIGGGVPRLAEVDARIPSLPVVGVGVPAVGAGLPSLIVVEGGDDGLPAEVIARDEENDGAFLAAFGEMLLGAFGEDVSEPEEVDDIQDFLDLFDILPDYEFFEALLAAAEGFFGFRYNDDVIVSEDGQTFFEMGADGDDDVPVNLLGAFRRAFGKAGLILDEYGSDELGELFDAWAGALGAEPVDLDAAEAAFEDLKDYVYEFFTDIENLSRFLGNVFEDVNRQIECYFDEDCACTVVYDCGGDECRCDDANDATADIESFNIEPLSDELRFYLNAGLNGTFRAYRNAEFLGDIDPPPDNWYHMSPGAQFDFFAVADAYHSISWYLFSSTNIHIETGGGSSPTKSVTVTSPLTPNQNIVLNLTFPRNRHEVTFAPVANITATVNDVAITSGSDVNEGYTVVFTANPPDFYEVEAWTIDGDDYFPSNPALPLYVYLADQRPPSGLNVEVRFRPITQEVSFGVSPIGSGVITASVSGVTIISGDRVNQNATVAFSVAPEPNFGVVGWTINGQAYDSVSSTFNRLIEDEDLIVYAVLEANPRSIFFNVGTGGTVVATVGGNDLTDPVGPPTGYGGTVQPGTTVQFVASPAEGFEVSHWNGNVTFSGDPTSRQQSLFIEPGGTIWVYVYFVPIHWITYTTNPLGIGATFTRSVTFNGNAVDFITSSGNIYAREGSIVTLTVVPPIGRRVSGASAWTVYGTADYDVIGGAEYDTLTLTVEGEDVEVEVELILQIHTVTVGPNITATFTVNSTAYTLTSTDSPFDVPHGTLVTFTATPEDNQFITEWEIIPVTPGFIPGENALDPVQTASIVADTTVNVTLGDIPLTSFRIEYTHMPPAGGAVTAFAGTDETDTVASGSYRATGTVVTFVATPGEHFRVSGWTVTVGGGTPVVNDNPGGVIGVEERFSVTVGGGNIVVSVQFEHVDPLPVAFVTNDVSANGAVVATGTVFDGTNFVSTTDIRPGHAVRIRVALAGNAGASGTHTISLTGFPANVTISPPITPATHIVSSGAIPPDQYVEFEFTMPSAALDALVVINTFENLLPVSFASEAVRVVPAPGGVGVTATGEVQTGAAAFAPSGTFSPGTIVPVRVTITPTAGETPTPGIHTVRLTSATLGGQPIGIMPSLDQDFVVNAAGQIVTNVLNFNFPMPSVPVTDLTISFGAFDESFTVTFEDGHSGFTRQGLTSAGVIAPAGVHQAGAPITVTVTLDGDATLPGTHTLGIEAVSPATLNISEPDSVIRIVEEGTSVDGETFVFTFAMPSSDVVLRVVHLFGETCLCDGCCGDYGFAYCHCPCICEPDFCPCSAQNFPRIIRHPSGTFVVYGEIYGDLDVLTSTPENFTFAFQWYRNTTNSNVGGVRIAGATSSSMPIPRDLDVGTHYFFVVVTATRESASPVVMRSNVAIVTVVEDGFPIVTITNAPTGPVHGQRGTGAFPPGSNVELVAGTRVGFNFVNWTTTTPGVVINHANQSTATFTMPDRDVSIVANWVTETLTGDFIGVVNPHPIGLFPHGTPATVFHFGLPGTVVINTTAGPRTALVTWNLTGIDYDPARDTEQTFVVPGVVELPVNINNPNDLDLVAFVYVTVQERAIITDRVFERLVRPNSIFDIPHGSPLTPDGLSLPRNVLIFTRNMYTDPRVPQVVPTELYMWADVHWNLTNVNYDSANQSEQTFVVHGVVVMPPGVRNPYTFPITVFVSVTVREFFRHARPPLTLPTPPPRATSDPAPVRPPVSVGRQGGAPWTGTATFPVQTMNLRNGHYDISVSGLPRGAVAPTVVRIHNNAFNPQLRITGLLNAPVGSFTLYLTIFDGRGVPVAPPVRFTLVVPDTTPYADRILNIVP